MIDGRSYPCHKLVWLLVRGEVPSGYDVDHFDGKPSNNAISNLRVVPKAVNMRNRRKLSNNTSGTTGVRLHLATGRGGKKYEFWEAAWMNLEGRHCRKSFSVLKYGTDVARKLAEQHRTQMIENLNSCGAGYSERHGTKGAMQ